MAQLRRERPGETIYVATKAGRRLNPHTTEGYNRENLVAFVERSLKNLARRADRPAAAPLPAERRLLPARSVRSARRPGGGRQAAVLRRERQVAGGRPQGDRLSERAERADHLQHVSPPPGRTVLRRSAAAARRHPGAGAAGVRAALRQADAGSRRLPPTTIASSIATARRSTSARRFRASTSKPASRRSRS